MSKTLIAIFIAALVLIGGYFLLSGEALAPEDGGSSLRVPAPGFENIPEMIVSPSEESAHTVTYTANGFSPAALAVKRGDAVTFVNEGGPNMWVASTAHPTHSIYDGTTLEEHCGGGAAGAAFDQCGTGTEFSFTFEKAGTWKYHNHMFTNHTGTIIVE